MQGVLLCIFRLIMFAAFIFGISNTKADLKLDKTKLPFIQLLLVSGSLYFLALPTFVSLTYFVAPYNQQLFIVFTTFFTQFMAYVLLIYQFSTGKSKYYEASY